MKRFVEGEDRRQGVLLPEFLDDWVSEENPVRVIDVFVDELDLAALGFEGVVPEATGRPAYHPARAAEALRLRLHQPGASSRRLEREAQRNVELMWLTGRLAPDFKTIADFRKDNGPAIRAACRQFVELCRRLGLFTQAMAAIDGSKFKAVNTRDKNFTRAKLKTADGAGGGQHRALHGGAGDGRPPGGRAGRGQGRAAEGEDRRAARADAGVQGDGSRGARRARTSQVSLTDPDARAMATSGRGSGIVGYNVQSAVDAEHHLIVAHEVDQRRHDREPARRDGRQGQGGDGRGGLEVLADRGYFYGEEVAGLRGASASRPTCPSR